MDFLQQHPEWEEGSTLTLLMTSIFSNQNQSPNERTALAYTINIGTKLITLSPPPPG